NVASEISKLRRQRRHGELIVIAAGLLVAIRHAVPMSAEAQHAHVHLAAAADDGHVARHLAVDEPSTRVDEHPLLCEREMSLQMKCSGRDFHFRTLSLGPMKRLGIAAALAFLALPRPASAHPIPFSYL